MTSSVGDSLGSGETCGSLATTARYGGSGNAVLGLWIDTPSKSSGKKLVKVSRVVFIGRWGRPNSVVVRES